MVGDGREITSPQQLSSYPGRYSSFQQLMHPFTYTMSSAPWLGEAVLGEAVGWSPSMGGIFWLFKLKCYLFGGMSPTTAALLALCWQPENLDLLGLLQLRGN